MKSITLIKFLILSLTISHFAFSPLRFAQAQTNDPHKGKYELVVPPQTPSIDDKVIII